jgi:hypothetical protein
MVETANATVGCVEHSLLPSSGDVFSTFRVTGWSAKALSVVRIRLFEKFVNSAIQNYGPIMVHEPVPTTTKHAFGSHPRRVFSISYLLTGFFHGANAALNPAGGAIFELSQHSPSGAPAADVLRLGSLRRTWTTYDLIISTSMLEYLSKTELPYALEALHGRLAPAGFLS